MASCGMQLEPWRPRREKVCKETAFLFQAKNETEYTDTTPRTTPDTRRAAVPGLAQCLPFGNTPQNRVRGRDLSEGSRRRPARRPPQQSRTPSKPLRAPPRPQGLLMKTFRPESSCPALRQARRCGGVPPAPGAGGGPNPLLCQAAAPRGRQTRFAFKSPLPPSAARPRPPLPSPQPCGSGTAAEVKRPPPPVPQPGTGAPRRLRGRAGLQHVH